MPRYRIVFTKTITARETATREFDLPAATPIADIAAWARIQGTAEGGRYTAMHLYFSDAGETETVMTVEVTPIADEPEPAAAEFAEVEAAPPAMPADPAPVDEEVF